MLVKLGKKKQSEVVGNNHKKGRVLLLTPNLNGMKDGVNRIQPPLGPMIAANVIRNDYGHDVKIHDTALADWDNQRLQQDGRTVVIGQNDADIARVIDEYQPDVIGISALFSNLMEAAHGIARIVKGVNPNVRVVLGGNYVSNEVEDVLYARKVPDSNMPTKLTSLENRHIDYAMWGEVDLACPMLADAIINGKDISAIPGLVMREGDDYKINPKPGKVDVKTLPLPARDLVNMESYFSIGAFHSAKSKSNRVLSVMASRGCPEKCKFCTTPDLWGQEMRWRDMENIVAELTEGVEVYKIGEIQMEDDSLTANITHLRKLCAEFEKLGLPWCTPNGIKANYHQNKDFTPGGKQLDMFRMMKDSGCYQLSIACESGVQHVLDNLIDKRLKLEAIKPAIQNAKDAGMIAHTFWIVGFPGETYEQIEETLKFAEQSGADSYSIAILNPLPGTPIYRQVMRENLWWPGRDASQMMFRNSLVQVDGFSGPDEFEKYITERTMHLNKTAYDRNPEKHTGRQGLDSALGKLIDPKAYLHQT